jgi:uncharacterized protein (DUF2141 family)
MHALTYPRLPSSILRLVLVSFVLVTVACLAPVLGQNPMPVATGSVSGQVSLDGQPAGNVVVTVRTPSQGADIARTVAKSKTGSDGRFQVIGLPPGKFLVTPQAPGFIVTNVEDRGYYADTGLMVTLAEGETLRDLRFTMQRGGVVTGRITSEDSRPVIAQMVTLRLLVPAAVTPAQNAPPPPGSLIVVDTSSRSESEGARKFTRTLTATTDDRGVYRFFGLRPGQYVVSAGTDTKGNGTQVFMPMPKTTFFPLVYYPDVPSAEAASLIEVEPGSETANIDLKLGKLEYGYQASGKVFNTKTGQPVARMSMFAERQVNDTQGVPIYLSYASRATTNERGEFTLTGLIAGRYRIRAFSNDNEGIFFPPAETEITDADVAGLVIKSKDAVTLSGTLVVDNTAGGPLPFRLDELNISASTVKEGGGQATYGMGPVRPDGSFRIGGLSAGKVRVYLFSRVNGLSLQRAERNGVAEGGPDPNAGMGGTLLLDTDNAGGNLVLHAVYGNCTLRGDVKRDGEPLTDSMTIQLQINRSDRAGPILRQQADIRGRFLVNGLTPGEYRVSATATADPGSEHFPLILRGVATVTVTTGAEATVTINVSREGNGP